MKKGRKKKIGGEDGLCPSQWFYSSVWFFLFQGKKKRFKKIRYITGYGYYFRFIFLQRPRDGAMNTSVSNSSFFPPQIPSLPLCFSILQPGIGKTEMNPFPFFFFFVFSYFSCFNRECSWAVER